MRELLKLFAAFFRIGLFTFGGGYSMLPMLQKEVVERYHWATEEDLLDYFAISQCTPGVIAVNTATFVGFTQKKLTGALFATLGVITPSIIIILLIASVLQNFTHIKTIQHAFAGVRVAVAALIVTAVIRLFKSSVLSLRPEKQINKNKTRQIQFYIALALCLLVFALMAFLDISPVYVVIGAIIVGLVFFRRDQA